MRKTTVLIVETQPVVSQGVAIALDETSDLCVIGVCDSIAAAREMAVSLRPDVVVIDLLVDDGSLLATLAGLDCAVVLLGDGDGRPGVANLGPGLPLLPKECSLEDLVRAIRHAHALGPIAEVPAAAGVPLPPAPHNPYEGVDQPRSTGLHELTRREIEILELLVQGKTHRVIAEELHLAINTVRTHTHNIHLKLNVHSDLGAVSFVLGEGDRLKQRASGPLRQPHPKGSHEHQGR